MTTHPITPFTGGGEGSPWERPSTPPVNTSARRAEVGLWPGVILGRTNSRSFAPFAVPCFSLL